MDFLDPKKKRAHTIRLYVGYALVAVAIGIGALILLYMALGYGVDRRGNVIQNGLVFLSSTPDAAEVNITKADGSFQDQTLTSERMVLPADTYRFEFLKQDYRPWVRTVDLRGGSLVRMNYPFLFPVELESKAVRQYAARPGLTTASPDRSRIVVQLPAAFNRFEVINADDPQETPEIIAVPTALFADGARPSLSLVEWSTNNRHLLVEYRFGTETEYIIIDTEEPEESVNVNQVFSVEPQQVSLRDKQPNELYMLLENNRLVSASVERATTSRIVSDVVAFKPHGDNTFVYVQDTDSKNEKVAFRVWDDGESFTVRSIPRDSAYLLDIARFNDNWYIAVGSVSADNVFIYRNPAQTLRAGRDDPTIITRTLHIDDPQKISFSNNAQFLAAQSNQRFAVYDAEADSQYRYEVDQPLESVKNTAWMDGHRLMGVVNGQIIVFDFDGENLQTLNAIISGTVPMFDRDYTVMYALQPRANRASTFPFVLSQTELRVENPSQ